MNKPSISPSPDGLLIVAAAIAFISVLFVPFFFPPSRPVPSQAYVVGYNNKLAAILLALICVSVTVWCIAKQRRALASKSDHEALGFGWLLVGIVVVAAWNGALSALAYYAQSYSVEDFYFLPQLEKYYYRHLHLYRDIEFAYGQLLFYPAIWIHGLLHPWHISLRAAYYVGLILNHIAGIALLYWALNRIPMSHDARVRAFCSFVLFGLTPLLGPNYTLFRYVLPIVLLVSVAQATRPNIMIAIAAIAQPLVWADSADQAIGFSVGLCALCLYSAWIRRDKCYLLPLAAAAATTFLYFYFVDRNYLGALVHMGRGWSNRAPSITLELSVLVIAAVVFAPRLVSSEVQEHSESSRLYLGLYAMGLALLPGALGAFDAAHVTGEGLVLFLLSFAATDRVNPTIRRLWGLAVLLTYFYMGRNMTLDERARFRPDIACMEQRGIPLVAKAPGFLKNKLRSIEERQPCYTEPINVVELQGITKGEQLEAPFPLPGIAEEQLVQLPEFLPSYWSGTIDLWDQESLQKKVDELRRVNWAILMGPPDPWPISPDIWLHFGKQITHRKKHVMTWRGPVADEITNNWVPVKQIGFYTVYRRQR